MLSQHSILRTGLTVTTSAMVTWLMAAPAPAADFYAGKSIDFLIGGDVGGGYDIYARVIARHLNRFIPGNPTIVPKNQPGAGSGRAASFLYSVAPKDGSVIGAVFPGAIMGASAAGGSTRDYINMFKKATGALFDLVAGYKGTADIFLAMERGEVDGMCGLDWASLKSQRPDWIRNKTTNILAQINLEPDAELLRLGVPQIWKYIRSADDKKAVELIIGQQVFGRPYLAPPGVPAEPIKILRAAFTATMQDKDFLADAERTRIDVVPSSGERVQQLVQQLYAAPKATVERAKDLVKP